MQVTETSSQGLKREYKVVLPARDLASRVDTQLNDLRGKARINGFRPGKVPVSHLRRLYGKSIMADVVQEAVNEANRKIVEDNSLRLATEPKLDLPEEGKKFADVIEKEGDLAFTVALEVLPKFEVGSFDDIEIERLRADIPDAEVDTILNRLADQNRVFTPKEGDDAVAATGDRLTIDFVGKIGGEAFEGGSAEGTDLVLGSSTFIPGFEEKLVGAKIGEERVVDVTFPEAYASPKLAGQAAVFDVTVKGIAAPGDVAIDDEFAKGFGFEDLAKLQESVRGNIEREYGAASRVRWKRALLDALDKKYAFDLPGRPRRPGIRQRLALGRSRAEGSGRTFEADGTSEDAARADYAKIAERRVRLGLLLAEIGEKAEIKVSDDEMSRAIVERARAYPGQEKQVWEFYTKNQQALAEIRAPLFEEKVVDHIAGLAKVTDRTVSKDELMKPMTDEDEPDASPAA